MKKAKWARIFGRGDIPGFLNPPHALHNYY